MSLAEPGYLSQRHLQLLDAWDAANQATWQARVDKKPQAEIDRLANEAWDRAGEFEAFKQAVANDFALAMRLTAESFPHLDVHRIRQDLDSLADATLGEKAGAA